MGCAICTSPVEGLCAMRDEIGHTADWVDHDQYQTPPLTPVDNIAPDCRHYQGDRPCVHNRLCRGCEHYEPVETRICIIKLGALGDVIRTLCLLPELRRRYPTSHITWVSLPNGCRMIADHPMIDRVMSFGATTAMLLQQEMFDLLISLDKEPEPCALAMSLFAKQKLGIGLSQYGTVVPLNEYARYYFHLGLSDELKFNKNTKTYAQLIYEALGFTYNNQCYELPVDQTISDRLRLRLATKGWRPNCPTVGINVGAGTAFANKMWQPQQIIEFIETLGNKAPAVQFILLGGPGEHETIERIMLRLAELGESECVIEVGAGHDEVGFVALVDVCDVIFSGDTMAMHVAIARGKGVVAFFGPTCEQEIDLFGRGEKLVARVPCAPCYKQQCDQNDVCLTAVNAELAADAVVRTLTRVGRQDVSLPTLPFRKAG